MKSLLVILTTSGLLFNVFIVEAGNDGNIKSPTGPAVHQPLIIFVDSKNLLNSVPNTSLSKFDELYSGTKYIFACPAEESDNPFSQTKNSLIVKGIYKVPKCEVVSTEIFCTKTIKNTEQQFNCGKPVIPSFAHWTQMTGVHGKIYTINAIGFEMYIEERQGISSELVDHQFLRLTNKFHWVTIIEILFDPVGLDVRDVIYQMNAYDILPKHSTTMQVQNYTLGKVELFECVRIEELYRIENQRYVFTKIFKEEEERKKYFDVDKGKFLVQVHLAPLEIFMIPHLQEAARTYGNIAPMWRVVRENAWKKLEHFLHFVVQSVGALNIISGTYDTLTLSSSGGIFLGNNRVRVPLAFYKIVVYHKTKYETQSILLVTVNNPFKNIEGVLCEENQCAQYGWDKIQNDDYTKGFTSCCPLNEDILDLLDVKFLQPHEYENVFSLKEMSFPDWQHHSAIYRRPQHSENDNTPKVDENREQQPAEHTHEEDAEAELESMKDEEESGVESKLVQPAEHTHEADAEAKLESVVDKEESGVESKLVQGKERNSEPEHKENTEPSNKPRPTQEKEGIVEPKPGEDNKENQCIRNEEQVQRPAGYHINPVFQRFLRGYYYRDRKADDYEVGNV